MSDTKTTSPEEKVSRNFLISCVRTVLECVRTSDPVYLVHANKATIKAIQKACRGFANVRPERSKTFIRVESSERTFMSCTWTLYIEPRI